MDSKRSPKAQILIREAYAEKCRREFAFFCKKAWKHVLSDKLVWNWHLDAICEHLQLVWQTYKDPEKYDLLRLVINVPPRTSKSMFTSVLWPAWIWAKDPSIRFLVGTAVENVAKRDAVLLHNLIDSAWYQTIFVNDSWGWCKDQDAKNYFKTTAGGHRLSVTTGARIVGVDGDVLIVDDPLDTMQAHFSKRELEEHVSWFETAFSSRATQNDKNPFVVIMQRVHSDDLSGHLMKDKKWKSLIIPAEFEGEQLSTTGFVDSRQVGEVIDKRRMSLEFLEDRKEKLGDIYETVFQQKPTKKDGNYFAKENFRFYNYHNLPESFDMVVTTWDTAYKKGDGTDFIVGQVWGRKEANHYLLHYIRRRMCLEETISAIVGTHLIFPHSVAHLIEIQATGKEICKALRNKIPGITEINHQGTTKTERAQLASIWVKSGNVYLPSDSIDNTISKVFLPEITGFPHKKHDDIVDAMTQYLIWSHENTMEINNFAAL